MVRYRVAHFKTMIKHIVIIHNLSTVWKTAKMTDFSAAIQTFTYSLYLFMPIFFITRNLVTITDCMDLKFFLNLNIFFINLKMSIRRHFQEIQINQLNL